MGKADRLFQIVQILRARTVVTAAQLSDELDVTERTIYRDIQDLMLSGVPIQSEAGVGYMLMRGFDLPPLMFDIDEIEAMVIGARIVMSRADDALAAAAKRALGKIEAAVPDRLRHRINRTPVYAPSARYRTLISQHMTEIRQAIENHRKIRLIYADAMGDQTERTVLPLAVLFWANSWTFASWCLMREDFRSFRLDRIEELQVLDEIFVPQPGQTLSDLIERENKRGDRSGERTPL